MNFHFDLMVFFGFWIVDVPLNLFNFASAEVYTFCIYFVELYLFAISQFYSDIQ